MYQQTTGKKKLIIGIVVILLFLVSINLPLVREAGISKFTRRVLLNSIYPFQYIFSSTFSRIGGATSGFFTLFGASRENAKLREENALLKAKTNNVDELKSENADLREKLGFKSKNPYRFSLVVADVISRSPSNWFETIFINRGSGSGVSVGDAVIDENGVVGRTVEVGRFSSKVMLITDPESSLGVMKAGSGDMGVAVGGAMNSLQIKYVGAGSGITDGDKIVTSGMGGVFPKGIPVGTVTKTSVRDFDLFKYVELKPLSDFSKLKRVFVVI